MPDFTSYLDKLKSKGGSELVLSAERAPLYRTDRGLAPLPGEAPVSDAELRVLLEELLGEVQWGLFLAHGSLRFSATHRDRTRVCGTLLSARHGLSSALRIVPQEPATCAALGIPAAAVSCMERATGLVVVAGTTRSGKTTTLAALIDHALAHGARHVTTVEDPIELMHGRAQVVVSHRQVGAHCVSFAAGIEGATRADSELIVVSELDAPGALEAALDAVSSGALVLGAVRTSSAAGASEHLLRALPSARRARVQTRLSEAVLCTLGQRLLPRKPSGLIAAYEVLLPPGETYENLTLEDAVNTLIAQGLVDAADKKLIFS